MRSDFNARSPTLPAPRPSLEIAPGLVAREMSYASHTRFARHSHPWAFIAVVIRGTVEEVCAGVRDVRGAGAVRIMPHGEHHANDYGVEGARCFVTEIHPAAANGLAAPSALGRPARHEPGSLVAAVVHRMYAEFRQSDDLSPLALDGMVRELIVAAVRAPSAERARGDVPPWLDRVRARLHDEFARAPSLASLAAEAGVHPSHLVRSFRRHYNRAPGEYVAFLRIEAARHALATDTEPISNIALRVGFSDQAHFTRRFRAATGITPARYRTLASSR